AHPLSHGRPGPRARVRTGPRMPVWPQDSGRCRGARSGGGPRVHAGRARPGHVHLPDPEGDCRPRGDPGHPARLRPVRGEQRGGRRRAGARAGASGAGEFRARPRLSGVACVPPGTAVAERAEREASAGGFQRGGARWTMTPRATFICGGALVPASRFRVHQVEAGLRACGWSTRLIEGYGPLDQRLGGTALQRPYRAACRLRRAWRTARLDSDGPVMVQRLAWPWSAMPEVRLAANCDGLVFDFDDAVFLGAGGRPSRSRRRALDAVFAASRYIVAGNSWLAQAVEAPVPVTVLPTCIDTSRYLPRPDRSPGGRPVIGWIGTSGNFPYLHRLVEPMRRLRAWGCDFDLRICSDV